jgi:tripartite-type tricarboxylate transporter receptor subunit TctC
MALTAGTALLAGSGASHAQGYPNKTIFIKVAYPAGGPTDAITRAAQPALQVGLGQPVIVENLPGAAGSIAAMRVRGLPADGYNLLCTTTDLILAPKAMAAAKYKAADFRAVGFILISDMILVASPKHSYRSVDHFIEQARNPNMESLSIAHWGYGSSPHLMGSDFQSKAKIKLLEVPYAGVSPIVPAMLGDQVDLSFMPFGGAVMNLIQTGKLKPIGVASDTRHPALPDVPTLNETRYLNGIDYSVWSGLFVPANTPLPEQEKLNERLRAWLATAEYQAISKDFGIRKFKPMTLIESNAFYLSEQTKLDLMAKGTALSPR